MCRSKWNSPTNSTTATRPWSATPSCWLFPNPAKPPTPSALARSQAARASRARHLQCGRQHHRARIRRRHLHARRAGNRRGLDQGVHLACWRSCRCWPCIWAGCGCSRSTARWRFCAALKRFPGKSKLSSPTRRSAQKLAAKYAQARDFFFLSRGYNFPIALEGALKLKEISYIHAEGYSGRAK